MKSCFFIGHREADERLLPALKKAIEQLIAEDVSYFYVGGYGGFDRIAGAAVKQAKKQHPNIVIDLVLPYHPAERPIEASAGYDGTYYPEGLENVPRQYAIVRANKIMVDGGKTMNIRKNIDYSEMYEALDILMQKSLPQMELYCEIGKAVCRRTEKGAAVMASEYLNEKYPDVKGFSPRSLRRMRDFYRTYENHPALLSRAMKLGWIQNVAIVEAVLAMELREWYIRAAQKFDWTKTELIARIEQEAHLELIIDAEQEKCEEIEICVVIITTAWVITPCVLIRIIKQVILQRCRGKPYREHLHDLCVLINI